VFEGHRIRTLVEQRLVAHQRGEEMSRGWRIVGPGHLLFPVSEQEQLMIEVVDISVHEGGSERVGCLPERALQARPRVQTPLVPGGHDLLERVREGKVSHFAAGRQYERPSPGGRSPDRVS
jgi:hypothetical protein